MKMFLGNFIVIFQAQQSMRVCNSLWNLLYTEQIFTELRKCSIGHYKQKIN